MSYYNRRTTRNEKAVFLKYDQVEQDLFDSSEIEEKAKKDKEV